MVILKSSWTKVSDDSCTNLSDCEEIKNYFRERSFNTESDISWSMDSTGSLEMERKILKRR